MSSLCNKIKKLDSGITKGNTEIIHKLTKIRSSCPSILDDCGRGRSCCIGGTKAYQDKQGDRRVADDLFKGYNPFDDEKYIMEFGHEGVLTRV